MKGTAASPGIAIAKAYIIDAPAFAVRQDTMTPGQVQEEIGLLQDAVDKAKKQLQAIYENIRDRMGETDAEIIQAHIALVEDPMLFDEIKVK